MRISTLAITALCILCCGSAGLCAQPAADGLQQRIQIQEQRLADIEQMAAQQTEQVETWCADQSVAVAQEISRRAAARIGLAERTLWVEFAKVQSGQELPEEYFNADYYGFALSYETAVERNMMIDEYLVCEMADLLLCEDFTAGLARIIDERWREPLLRKEAAGILSLAEQVQVEAKAALRNVEYRATSRIEAIAAWEKDLTEQAVETLNFLRTSGAKKAAIGTVGSIGCSAQHGWMAEIEGIAADLQPGDSAHGILVLSISPGGVRFSKNGATWTQQIGAAAPSQWD